MGVHIVRIIGFECLDCGSAFIDPMQPRFDCFASDWETGVNTQELAFITSTTTAATATSTAAADAPTTTHPPTTIIITTTTTTTN